MEWQTSGRYEGRTTVKWKLMYSQSTGNRSTCACLFEAGLKWLRIYSAGGIMQPGYYTCSRLLSKTCCYIQHIVLQKHDDKPNLKEAFGYFILELMQQ